MLTHALLIGPSGHGGEGVYVDGLQRDPPDGVSYDASTTFHSSTLGASCVLPVEVALNQLVRRCTIPDIGFRAFKLRSQYDLVHVHAHPVWLRGRCDIPLVMSEGSSSAVYLGDYLGWDPRRIRAAFRRSQQIYRALRIRDRLLAMDRAQCVYVFSEWARDVNIRWGADPSKLSVIYPGFDTPPSVDRSRRKTFTFLFVGSDFERKGGYEVIEAFAQIAGDLPDVRLVIAGSDPATPNPDLEIHSWVSPQRRRQAEDLLSQLLRAGRAVRVPWIDGTRLRSELFPAADAFVMPTYAEGFGFATVEAMSFGLPIISSTAGPAREIVQTSATGILLTAGDVAALATAMHNLAANPDDASAMGAAARRQFQERFTRERFKSELGALYNRAIRSR